ncbi:MAG TPA: retroviral-like aspartic protease family protein [Thermoguttaceae bacterium]|nr:retroviral-like aspartic protease family protein [Thermoguttaceae bacterium]
MDSHPEPPPSAGGEQDSSGDAPGQEGTAQAKAEPDRLAEFEAVMDRYFRSAPLGEAVISLDQRIDEHNRWVESTNARHEGTRAELETESESLRAVEKEIKDLDTRLADAPGADDRAAVDAYNALVTQRNALVEQYNQLGKSCQERQAAYNDSVARDQQEIERRQKELDSRRAAFRQQVAEEYRRNETGEDLSFFKRLNRFYADLLEQQRNAETPELAAKISRVRAMRRELAEHAVKRHETAESGLLIVEATLCRHEKCFLIVDTGATVVSISPALVDAAGLSDQLGKETEATLAGGIKIRGRELTIPQLSVLAMDAQDVKAVVLDESEVGVDGLLGLSFLNRFDFRIDRSHPDKLILKSPPDE